MTDPLSKFDESHVDHARPKIPIAPQSLPYEVPGSMPHHFPAWNAASAAILIILACCLGLISIALFAAAASEIGTRRPDVTRISVLSLFALGLGIATISSTIGARRHLRRARGRDR